MSEAKYFITVDSIVVAENVTMEYALIFVRAIFDKYWNEKEMEVAMQRMPEEK